MALAALAWLVVFTMGHPGEPGADEIALRSVQLTAMGLTALAAAQLLQRLLGYALLGRASTGAKASSDLLRSVLNATLYLVAFVLFLRYGLEQDVTRVLATSAILTVIVGMALQPTLGHLFSGVSIEIERPLRVGDYLRRDELEGQVVALSWRSVSLRTDRGTTLVMPNAEFTSRSVEIIRALQPSRHQAMFHMPSDCSPSQVIGIAMQVLRSGLAGVSATPPPSVIVLGTDPATGTLRFAARFFTCQFLDRSSIVSLVLERLWFALSREGLALPLPPAFEWAGEGGGVVPHTVDPAGPHPGLPRISRAAAGGAHPVAFKALALQALAGLPPGLGAALHDRGRLLRYGPGERCESGRAGVVLQGRLIEDRPPAPEQVARELDALRLRVLAQPALGSDAPLLAPEVFDRFLSRAALALGPLAHTLCPRIAASTEDASLAHALLAESIADVGRRRAFLTEAGARPMTHLGAGAWFGWPALLGLEAEAHACRAALESAVFVWDAPSLRHLLAQAPVAETGPLASLLDAGGVAGATPITGERLRSWANAGGSSGPAAARPTK